MTRQKSVVFPQSSSGAVPQEACEPAGQPLSWTLNSLDLIKFSNFAAVWSQSSHIAKQWRSGVIRILISLRQKLRHFGISSHSSILCSTCVTTSSHYSFIYLQRAKVCSPMSFTIHPKQVKFTSFCVWRKNDCFRGLNRLNWPIVCCLRTVHTGLGPRCNSYSLASPLTPWVL